MQPRRLGKYEVVDRVGRGAMGEVFRARDPVLERDVAIKIVAEAQDRDRASRDRFLREAKAAAQLNHPNIVTVHEFGEDQGVAYMAMELLEGRDLRDLVEKGPLGPVTERLSIMLQVLDGVAFAHARGVVHRDLKPANVHVLPDGQVKILDFGLAQRPTDDSSSGSLRATPYYIAPELVRGERASLRSDVFSLGALFYELLAGRRPFTGATIPAVLAAVVQREPEPIEHAAPLVGPSIGAVVTRALRKAPEERFEDAGEMLEALRLAWAQGEEDGGPGVDEVPAVELPPPLSAREGTSEELRAALDEIDEYLADRVAPLMVADSVAAFADVDPADAAAQLAGWAQRQKDQRPELPLAELLFHALHKLSVVGELELVDGARLLRFLRGAGAVLVGACPPAERAAFRLGLDRLGESELVRTDAVNLVRRPREAEREEPAAAPPATPGLRRLALLEQRLRREAARGQTPEEVRRRLLSQAVATAATEARNERELQGHLRRLQEAGLSRGTEQVLRSLGQELADWAVPREVVAGAGEAAAPREVRAMERIVSLPEDAVEVARRYRQLVAAATEQFNEGNLGRAVQMFGLAARLAEEKKVESGYTEPTRRSGHEALDRERLRSYMEKPERHSQLREVMAFFERGLGAESLLDQLETEPRRDRRRMLLDLLVVHGARARALARARLLGSQGAPASDFARRNWIYLTRLVPRAESEAPEPEIDATGRLALPGPPAFLVKEALLALGSVRNPRSAEALAALLEAWEAEAEKAGSGLAGDEAVAVLDRVAAALARQDAAGAWSTLLEHALRRADAHGDTLARLGELGARDLSSHPAFLETIAAEIRERMPRGVLGRLMGRGAQELPALVGALAGTRSPAARATLEEVKRRCQGQEAGRVAARLLETSTASTSPQGASGDLERYGLPAVLHRLALSGATGTLHLTLRGEPSGESTLELAQGRLVSARFAHRAGRDAFRQLFLRPAAGAWAFEPGAAPAAEATLGEILPLLREAMARAAETRRLAAIVPEEAPLEPTGQAPGSVQDEDDYALVVSLWQRACAGEPARRIESELEADAFRILRPLAQWLEEGALRPAGADPTPSYGDVNAAAPGT